jgi:hypothetical protein
LLKLCAIVSWYGDEMILRFFVVVQPIDQATIEAINGINGSQPPIQLASGPISYLQQLASAR